MKITRKGFTLVELLIVVAILATLSASMMVSFGSSTSVAKAASIAANIDTCVTAAKIYYAENINTVTTTTDTTAIQAKISNWDKMSANGKITYALDGTGPTGWMVKVDFSNAPDKDDVATALENIQGYNTPTDKTAIDSGKFSVVLLDGTIAAVTTTSTGG